MFGFILNWLWKKRVADLLKKIEFLAKEYNELDGESVDLMIRLIREIKPRKRKALNYYINKARKLGISEKDIQDILCRNIKNLEDFY